MKQIINKEIVLLAIVCIVSVFSTGCSSTRARVESIAKEHAESFASGEMEEINQIIFGMPELHEETEFVEMQGSDIISEKGMLSIIFSHSTIVVEKVTEDSVKLKISAPDMSELLFYLRKAPANFKIGLTDYVNAYVNKAEMKENRVSVSYTVEKEAIIIDYFNEEFINAVTGGLLEAYKEAYIDEVEQYREEAMEW